MADLTYDDALALAASLPDSLPPLAVDIDGTLTDDDRAIDPRVFPVLRSWPAPVVIATGKALPYPVGLCEFLGIETRVIAENGGVLVPGRDSDLQFLADPDAADAVARAYQNRGHDLGWGAADLVNRWRETEIAVNRESPLSPLEALTTEYDLTVVDTGYAYHVHDTDVDKGKALAELSEEIGIDTTAWAFVGDSPNDVPGFDRSGTSLTVANAPDSVKDAADHVASRPYGSGFLDAVTWLCDQM